MSNEGFRLMGVVVFDVGIAMVVYYGLQGFIGNYPAAAVMILSLGTALYVQGVEVDDETPEERVLGDTDE